MIELKDLIDRAKTVLTIRNNGVPLEFAVFIGLTGFRVQAEGGTPTDTFPTIRPALRQFIAREMAVMTAAKAKHDQESTRLAVGAAQLEAIDKEVRDE